MPTDNPFLQIANVIGFAAAGVLDQTYVPRKMKIAGVLSTLGLAELHNMNFISSAGFSDCVQGLMDVPDKVHHEFQCLHAVLARGVLVGDNVCEQRYSVHHAIMVIFFCRGVSFIRAVTVSRFRET